MKWACNICHTSFSTKGNLKNHKDSVHEGVKHDCDQCDYKGTTRSSVQRHKNSVHNPEGKDVFTCSQCVYTSNRKDSMKRHMKQHEKKTPQKEVTPHQKEVCEKIEYQSTLDMTALKNSIVGQINEYERKLELGRGIKEIVLELNAPTACLSAEHREALELFEKHGQANDVKPVRP